MSCIIQHSATGTFFLQGATSSYVLRVLPSGLLAHLHWGARVAPVDLSWLALGCDRAFSPDFPGGLSRDILPQEAPTAGSGDFRPALIGVRQTDGSNILDLRVTSHRIIPGKPTLDGLPSTYVESTDEATTLELTLTDALSGLEVIFTYTVFHGTDALTRSWRAVNRGDRPVTLTRALSASVDVPHAEWTVVQLSGSWAKERLLTERVLGPGTTAIASRRGTSSHQHNPFLALRAPDAGEEHGEVRAMHLVYSGNFLAQAEVDQGGTTRLQIGLEPTDFSWALLPGAAFQAPEVVLVRSGAGLGPMSRTFHHLYRTRLVRGPWRDTPKPVLINNWEATYFNFTTPRLIELAKAGKEVGCDLFVLDDGWFGKRTDDRSSLGDWTTVDETRLPGGLRPLAEAVNALGMRFGLWFEPEMVSPDSDLYRAHPDWCLHVPGRPRTEGRQQLVLDLGRAEIREHLWQALSSVLRSAPIGFIKWDMNRHLTEVWSPALPAERQGEVAHRYVLGLYALLERLRLEFPDILVEGCSGGGGRFDPGMLAYHPIIWTSDNTDAIERLRIQAGTSLAYPLSCMDANIAAIPNHQVGRRTPLSTRAAVATTGAFGYQLDLLALSADERAAMARHTERWRRLRHLPQHGDLYRLLDPRSQRWGAWMCVRPDRGEALVTAVRMMTEVRMGVPPLLLRGLNPDLTYHVVQTTVREDPHGKVSEDERTWSARGDALMGIGLRLEHLADFTATTWHLQAE